MRFLGGYFENFEPRNVEFLALYSKDIIIGVNSFYLDPQNFVRSRGLYVFPEYRKLGAGVRLLDYISDYFKQTDSHLCWSIPRVSALPTYQKARFVPLPQFDIHKFEFGPNCYAFRLRDQSRDICDFVDFNNIDPGHLESSNHLTSIV